jgi:hypothetical protein
VTIMGHGSTLAACRLSIQSIETETDELHIGATPLAALQSAGWQCRPSLIGDRCTNDTICLLV